MANKKIHSNFFVFPVLEQVLVVLDLGLNKDKSDGINAYVVLASVLGLSTPLSFFNLLDNDSLPKVGRPFLVLLFYNRFADGPVHTHNTDDQLVEPHYSMFLQNLMHHSQLCLCYKSNIFIGI